MHRGARLRPDPGADRPAHGHAASRPTRATSETTSTSRRASPRPATAARSSSRARRASSSSVELVDLGEHRLKDIAAARVASSSSATARFPPLKTISNTNLPRPASSFLGREARARRRCSRGSRRARGSSPSRARRHRQDAARARGGRRRSSRSTRRRLLGRARLASRPRARHRDDRPDARRQGRPRRAHRRARAAAPARQPRAGDRGAPELAALLRPVPTSPCSSRAASSCACRARSSTRCRRSPSPRPSPSSASAPQLEPSDEIAELCARLDSLPLAVELAAARTKALSPAQILERLSQRLDLLKGGRDADPRQQTLRATIEWSYDLLSAEEQQLFARLSVFAGGCTLEAAEEVSDADLDTLQSLVEKSLLRFTNERYWMLETIREYAGERLERRREATSSTAAARGVVARARRRKERRR